MNDHRGYPHRQTQLTREREGKRRRERGGGRKLKENPWRVRDDRLWIINKSGVFRFFRNGIQFRLDE